MLTDSRPRRCALAGCDAPLRQIEGRPEPTYCSAAHRARAREERRAERLNAPENGDSTNARSHRVGLEVPWQPEPPRTRRDAPGRGTPLSVEAQRRRQRALVRKDTRQRTLAVLGAAGILAAGSFVVVSSSSEQQAQLALAQLAPSAFSTERGEEWARQAKVKLASLSSQLEELSRAEQEWSRTPLAKAGGARPAPVQELFNRAALVAQQHTILASQLAAWDSMPRVQNDAAAAEAQLTRAERALRDVPSDARLTREAAAVRDQLIGLRDLRKHQADARKAELDGLQRGVAAAADNPLADSPERTSATTRAVRDLTDGPRRPPPIDRDHQQPPAVASRDGDGKRAQAAVNNGAPPNRGPAGDDPVRRAVRAVDTSSSGSDESSSQPEAPARTERQRASTPRPQPRTGSAYGTRSASQMAAASMANPFAAVSPTRSTRSVPARSSSSSSSPDSGSSDSGSSSSTPSSSTPSYTSQTRAKSGA